MNASYRDVINKLNLCFNYLCYKYTLWLNIFSVLNKLNYSLMTLSAACMYLIQYMHGIIRKLMSLSVHVGIPHCQSKCYPLAITHRMIRIRGWSAVPRHESLNDLNEFFTQFFWSPTYKRTWHLYWEKCTHSIVCFCFCACNLLSWCFRHLANNKYCSILRQMSLHGSANCRSLEWSWRANQGEKKSYATHTVFYNYFFTIFVITLSLILTLCFYFHSLLIWFPYQYILFFVNVSVTISNFPCKFMVVLIVID